MTRRRAKKNYLSKRFFAMAFFGLLLLFMIYNIQSTYAYYYNDKSLPILSNLIGDFDLADGDINIIIYKETKVGSSVFLKTYTIPDVGYSLNISKTTCESPSKKIIDCKKDSSSSECNYIFDEKIKNIELTSNQKTTCKFYFNKNYNNDVELHLMMQDTNGTHTFNGNNYRNIDSIPAYGFTYSGYQCKNGSKVTVDSETGNLKVLATQEDVCYAYYDGNIENANIIVNVYVQKEVNGEYVKVDSIPTNQKYKKSEVEQSYCHTGDNTPTNLIPTYENQLINIPQTNQNQICEVYLDIDS